MISGAAAQFRGAHRRRHRGGGCPRAGVGCRRPFPAVDNLIDRNVFAPRIGAIYDLAGDGRILKFNYGQYWDGPGIELARNTSPNSNEWWQHYSWSDLNKSGIWERGEEGVGS